MTPVPLPEIPCVRIALDYTDSAGVKGGSRFYMSYTGGPPSGADCTTLAADVASSWNTDLAPHIDSWFHLTEVDVLDIATDAGFSGQWVGDQPGTIAGANFVPVQCATNVEFGLARRYRGGKPRMYLPPASTAELADPSHWTAAHANNTAAAVGTFMAALEALAIPTIATLKHVSISYFSGSAADTDVPGLPDRQREAYRPVAKVDNVTGYFGKTVIGSQRRRRVATTY